MQVTRRDVPKGETMKLAKSFLGGVTALGLATGVALADDSMPDIGTGSTEYMNEPIVVYGETWVVDPLTTDEQVTWNDSQASELSSAPSSADSELGTDLALSPEDYDVLSMSPQDPWSQMGG
jgi:hypothetical protein